MGMPGIKADIGIASNFVFLASCKKIILEQGKPDPEAREIFFNSSSSVSNPVKEVMNEFKRRNENSKFIASFSKKYGSPLWDKSFFIRRKNSRSEINSKQGDGKDSVLLIPVVKENAVTVASYPGAHRRWNL